MTEIECGALQDRMPDVAAGTVTWTPAEQAHVASCEECALEWRIVQSARRLGDAAAAKLDSSALATRVLHGVRKDAARSRWKGAAWVSGLAAAAVVVLVLRVGVSADAFPIDSTGLAVEGVTGAIPMAELDALDADQLEAVLEHLDAAAGSAETGGVPSMGDLDDQQLERVLRSLEG